MMSTASQHERLMRRRESLSEVADFHFNLTSATPTFVGILEVRAKSIWIWECNGQMQYLPIAEYGFKRGTEQPFRHQACASSGFGIETDIRDHDGQVVLSHDVPLHDDRDLVSYSDLLEMLEDADERSSCALNVKSDGLLNIIQDVPHGTRDTCRQLFYFDMSIPETVQYLKRSLRVFTRVSEFEAPVFPQSQITGIWLDAFGDEFDQAREARRLLDQGYIVAMVSPELHG